MVCKNVVRTNGILALLLLLIFTGCGSNSLSGRFVSAGGEYLDFIGRRDVLLVSGNTVVSGIYELNGRRLVISFNHGGFWSDEHFTLSSDGNSINFGGMVFAREGAGGSFGLPRIPWWGWIIGFIVVSNVVGYVYKLITGKELGG